MLHIIGVILKCIGMLAAVLLMLLLLLLGVVLLVPVRYEGTGAFPGKLEKLHGKAKATWLFHLARADARWQNGEVFWKVRVAWKSFGGETSEETAERAAEETVQEAADVRKKKHSKTEKVENGKKRSEEEQADDGKKKCSDAETSKKMRSDAESEMREAISRKAKTTSQSDEKNTSANDTKRTKRSLFGKIKKLVRTVFQWIQCTFRKICDKIKESQELKERVMAFLRKEAHQNAVVRAKKEFVWLKRFFGVKKGYINLRFGFEDPSLTGKMLGALGILYPIVNGNLYVTPEFEEECLEGEVYLKGQMRLIHLLILIIRMAADQNVRQTYRDIMEWKDS